MTPQNLSERLMYEILNVVICGGGKVGPGICVNYLSRGHHVTLFDINPDALECARKQIQADLDFMSERGLCETQHAILGDRLTLVTELSQIDRSDIVIEAIFEDLNAKMALLSQLCPIVGEDCIIGSNTSTLDLQAMVPAVISPRRFMGIHFVYPASLVPEMELARVAETDVDLFAAMQSVYSTRLGMKPALLRAQRGLFGNRQQFAGFDVALRAVESGATIPQVDCAFRAICQQIGFTGIFGHQYLSGNIPVFAAQAEIGENPYDNPVFLETLRSSQRRFAANLQNIDGLAALTGDANGQLAQALVARWLADGIDAVNSGVGTMMAFETMLKAYARRYAATGIIGAAYLGGLPLFAKLYKLMADVNGYQQPLPTVLTELNDGIFVGVNPYANDSEVLKMLVRMRDELLLAAILL